MDNAVVRIPGILLLETFRVSDPMELPEEIFSRLKRSPPPGSGEAVTVSDMAMLVSPDDLVTPQDVALRSWDYQMIELQLDSDSDRIIFETVSNEVETCRELFTQLAKDVVNGESRIVDSILTLRRSGLSHRKIAVVLHEKYYDPVRPFHNSWVPNWNQKMGALLCAEAFRIGNIIAGLGLS